MKQYWKDKRGSSLVMVMITMTFLILLAGAVITSTITNIRLKASQKKTQENFYETDSALDEISAGIQDLSSKASADAYEKALALYNVAKSQAETTMDDMYTRDFLENMVKALTPDGSGLMDGVVDYEYDDDKLASFLKEEEKNAGVYLYHTDNGNKGEMKLEGDSLLLKDVSVKKLLEAEADYETTLKTDIRIEVPSATTETHSEYLSYAILADDQIIVDKHLASSAINGNIYAGTINRTATDDTKAGIVIEGSNLSINAEYIITRGDLSVANDSDVKVGAGAVASQAKLWAENIVTKGDSSKLTLDADSYIADDLEINGTQNVVTLKGRYYGYNYTDNYSDADLASGKLAKQAPYSSSISINGKKDQLLMGGLNELVLAGRTFISKKTKDNEIEHDSAGQEIFNPDVELGESLAVRSSQLAYLVGAQKANDTSGFVKLVSAMGASCSPPTGTDYGYGSYTNGTKQIRCYFFNLDGTQYLFDYQAYITNLALPDPYNDIDLETGDISSREWGYINDGKLNEQQPLALYYRPDPAVPGDDVRYFYLNFANTTEGRKAATGFYDVFFNKSDRQQMYDEINKTYADAYAIKLNDNADFILSSGNIMYSDTYQDGKLKVKLENPDGHPTKAFTSFATESCKEYMSRQLSLVSNYEGAKSSKWRLYDDLDSSSLNDGKLTKSGRSDKTNLFDVLVDRSRLPVGAPSMGSYTVKKTNAAGVQTDVECAYIVSGSNATIQWPNTYTNAGHSYAGTDFYGIIVAAGDVVINSANFHGMIISGGDVKIDMDGTVVNSDEEVITNVFEADKQGAKAFYNVLSKYFRKSVDATIGNSDSGDPADTNNVSYENWKKNE